MLRRLTENVGTIVCANTKIPETGRRLENKMVLKFKKGRDYNGPKIKKNIEN